MIHNKYFEILEQFLGDYTRQVYGRELINKVSMSQKGIALALEDLEKQNILRSSKKGSLKYYCLNLKNSEIKDIIILAEIMKKINFLKKHRKIAHLTKEIDSIAGIFGSYAKGSEKPSSDLDIFIIGTKKIKLNSTKPEISIKQFTVNEWKKLLKNKNNLCKEILQNHILLSDTESFIKLSWGKFYGYD